MLEDCDRAKIEAALAAPSAGFGDYEKYATLFEKAASLLYALAKAHGCPNGNKRLASVLTLAYLFRNQKMLWVTQTGLAEEVLRICDSETRAADAVRSETAAWLETHCIDAVRGGVLIQSGKKMGETL